MNDRLPTFLKRYSYACLLAGYVATLVVLHAVKRFPAPSSHDTAALIGMPLVRIEGRIVDFPSTRWSQTRFVLNGSAQARGRTFHGKTLVTLTFPRRDLAPGQWVRVQGWLSPPKAPTEIRPFDEEGYWASQGVYSLLRVWSFSGLEELHRPPMWYLRYHAWRFRQRFEDFWEARLLPDESAMLLGITLGARGQLPADLKIACIRAGVYHIVVVSGQDVALVISLGLAMLQAMRIPRRQGFLICVIPVGFYALVVGGDPPVVRAATMALVGLSATALGRDTARFQPFLLAAGGILLVAPEALFGASFQLSFGATASLLFLSRWLGDPRRFIPDIRFRNILGWFLNMGCLCIAVNIGVGPILVYYFQRFSLVGLLGNWLVFPFAASLMIWGLAEGIVGVICPALIPQGSIAALNRLLDVLVSLIRFLGGGRWSAIQLPSPAGWELAVYYGILFGILWAIPRGRGPRR